MEWDTPLYIDIAGRTMSVFAHMVFILIFRYTESLSGITRLWKTRTITSLCKLFFIFIFCTGVNLASKVVCASVGQNSWYNLILRFLLILLVTPTSVLLEWLLIRVVSSYADWVSGILIQLCFGEPGERLLEKNISELFLSVDKLEVIRKVADKLSQPIKSKLEQTTGHTVKVLPTGSLFEQYGQPAHAKCLKSNLMTDYDIMFVFSEQDLPIEIQMKNDSEVFLHILALSDSCSLLNKIKEIHPEEPVKLSAEMARYFMKNVVEGTNRNMVRSTTGFKDKLQTMIAFLFNIPQLGR